MGAQKSTTVNTGSTQSSYTPTAAENQLNQDQADIFSAGKPSYIRNQQSGLDASNALLTGQPLPGYLSGLPGGITDADINDSIQLGLRDLNPMFQQNGILNSGSAASIAARFAAEQRLGAKQFNIQNLMQLLNLGVGGQAIPLQLGMQTGSMLGQRLAGLRSGTTTSQGSQVTSSGRNPFVTSFLGSFGQSLGSGTFGAPQTGWWPTQ